MEDSSLYPQFPEGTGYGARLLRGLPYREAGVQGQMSGEKRSMETFTYRVMGKEARINPLSPLALGFLYRNSRKLDSRAGSGYWSSQHPSPHAHGARVLRAHLEPR